MKKNYLLLTIFLSTTFILNAQVVRGPISSPMEKQHAKDELNKALENPQKITFDSSKAINLNEISDAYNFAESILFKTYGKEKIEKEEPYHIQRIDDYWVMWGTLDRKFLGGVFLIIFNALNGKLIKLTHGK